MKKTAFLLAAVLVAVPLRAVTDQSESDISWTEGVQTIAKSRPERLTVSKSTVQKLKEFVQKHKLLVASGGVLAATTLLAGGLYATKTVGSSSSDLQGRKASSAESESRKNDERSKANSSKSTSSSESSSSEIKEKPESSQSSQSEEDPEPDTKSVTSSESKNSSKSSSSSSKEEAGAAGDLVPVASSESKSSSSSSSSSEEEDEGPVVLAEPIEHVSKAPVRLFGVPENQGHHDNAPLCSYGAYSVKGRRSSQEDADVAILNFTGRSDMAFFGVFDGHGGVNAANYCAEHFAAKLAKHPELLSDTHKALRETFLAIDEDVLALDSDDGCTAVVGLVIGKKLYVANAGDARLLVRKKDGTTAQLSYDHKPNDERERIESVGGFVLLGRVQGSLAVAHAIGDKGFKRQEYTGEKDELKGKKVDFVTCEPYIGQISLTDDIDFIVLTCDGPYDPMNDGNPGTNEQVTDFIANKPGENNNPNLQVIAHELVNDVVSRGSKDNNTAIIVRLNQ